MPSPVDLSVSVMASVIFCSLSAEAHVHVHEVDVVLRWVLKDIGLSKIPAHRE